MSTQPTNDVFLSADGKCAFVMVDNDKVLMLETGSGYLSAHSVAMASGMSYSRWTDNPTPKELIINVAKQFNLPTVSDTGAAVIERRPLAGAAHSRQKSVFMHPIVALEFRNWRMLKPHIREAISTLVSWWFANRETTGKMLVMGNSLIAASREQAAAKRRANRKPAVAKTGSVKGTGTTLPLATEIGTDNESIARAIANMTTVINSIAKASVDLQNNMAFIATTQNRQESMIRQLRRDMTSSGGRVVTTSRRGATTVPSKG